MCFQTYSHLGHIYPKLCCTEDNREVIISLLTEDSRRSRLPRFCSQSYKQSSSSNVFTFAAGLQKNNFILCFVLEKRLCRVASQLTALKCSAARHVEEICWAFQFSSAQLVTDKNNKKTSDACFLFLFKFIKLLLTFWGRKCTAWNGFATAAPPGDLRSTSCQTVLQNEKLLNFSGLLVKVQNVTGRK